MQEIYEYLAAEMNSSCMSKQNLLYKRVEWTWKDVANKRGFCRSVGLWDGCAGELCTRCCTFLKRLDDLKRNNSEIIDDILSLETVQQNLEKDLLDIRDQISQDVEELLNELKGRDTFRLACH